MNFAALWMKLFGTTEWLGLDIGFWASMTVVTLLVVVMNVVFWSMRPKTPKDPTPTTQDPQKSHTAE